MLLFIALYLVTEVAATIEVPRPVFSDVYSMRVEFSNHWKAQKIWVDKVHNRSRNDFLGVDGQAVYEEHNEEWGLPIIHWIFPVTTEERGTIRTCFIANSWSALVFIFTLYTLPDMKNYYYVGQERMHDEEASKWQEVHWHENWSRTFTTIWVAQRNGVFVPLRISSHTEYGKISDGYSYVDFFDYDTSDIDPEIWNIGKGMDCRLGISVEEDDLELKEKIDLLKVSEEYKHFNMFTSDLRDIHHREEMRRMVTPTPNHIAVSKAMGPTHHQKQVSSSRQSKALPFPYTAEEVERLSKNLPTQFDWRVYGAVRPPTGEFSLAFYANIVTAAVEAALFIQRGMKEILLPLSMQAIIDCSWGFGNRGIEEGSAESSFEWMMVHGIPTELAYPTKDQQDRCYIENVKVETKVKSYSRVTSNDVNALKLAIIRHGPVVVKYSVPYGQKFGLVNDTKMCPYYYVHQGLVVGYGSADDVEYWIIRSSYRYWHIAIKDNLCGVMDSPIYVTLE